LFFMPPIILESSGMRITERCILIGILFALGAPAERVTITLLATTDLHANIYPYDYYTARPAQRGLAKIATLVRAARRENPHSILIDCGDTIQGTPIESVYQYSVRTGALPVGMQAPGPLPAKDPMMLAMNALGYRAMVLGNHEFNFGLRNLEKARSDAQFPWLSANTVVEPGSRVKPFEPYVLITVAGVKVAIVGVTTPAIPSWEGPDEYKGLRFLDGTEAARAAVEEVRRKHQPGLVIAAVHAGLGSGGENMVRAIATGVRGIDAVVYGHSHQQEEALRIGDVLLVQPKNWGASLARLDFDLDSAGGGWKLAAKRSRLIPVRAATPADPEMLRLAKPYHELAELYLKTPVAEAPASLHSALGRLKDTALVDAIHEVQLHYAKADVSFAALFNLEVSVPKGPVTARQIAALYLYDNELYAIEGNGKMVKDALENAARFYRSCPTPACDQGPLINRWVAGYSYDTAQGVTYEIDLARPAGGRIVNLRWKGRPLQPDQKLRIAVNNHRAGGSAGYGMFRLARVLWRSGDDLRNLIVTYFIERGRLPAKPDDNWRVVPEAARRTLEAEARPTQ
jgi:2',3'-cyclic-nucleotide 2'-phosphodiesterase/3'-nucleotidase